LGAALTSTQSAIACSTDLWAVDTGVTAGTPADNVARYSGECAAKSSNAFVQDDSPGQATPPGLDRIVARFYVLVGDSGSPRVYSGFDDAQNRVFDVRVDVATGDVSLDSPPGGSVELTCSGCAVAEEWNSIEVDWNSGASTATMWVNSDARSVSAPDPSIASGAIGGGNLVSTVRLGNLNGSGGELTVDAYESRRTQPIGRLCVGDADGNGSIQFFDVTAIFEEVSSAGINLAKGQPDVDENGEVQFFDVSDAFGLVSAAVDCP
jgi:hypothetical protein